MKRHTSDLLKFSAVTALALGLAACGPGDKGKEPDPKSTSSSIEPGADTESIVKARQANFKKIGASMKALGEEVKGGTADSDRAKAAIATIVELTADIPEWFPEGSGPVSGVKTKALPVIWEKWSDFEAIAKQINVDASLVKTRIDAGSVDNINGPLRRVASSCKTCHETFKAEK